MKNTDTDSAELTRLVRGALSHLYDHAYLQNCALSSMLDLNGKMDSRTRVHHLRRMLMDCIEALRPDRQDLRQVEAVRAHAILTGRYVDGLTMQQIAEELALSPQQAYREHKKGLEAVAGLIRDRLSAGKGAEALAVPIQAGGEQILAAEAEVDRMTQASRSESVNMREILEGVLKLLLPLTRQTHHIITLSPQDEWPLITADRTALRQALISLLTHALSVARADLIVVAQHQDSGLILDITESSDAVGAQPAPAAQSQIATGLVVARRLIESQGGRLETAPGAAARWSARLFLPTARKTTILVVDDNADMIGLFQRYLAGYEVTIVGVTDSAQTLPLATKLQPRLITLDVMMPQQDGWEVLQRLKESPETQHIPVIVCSVLKESRLALSMGASDYITKPISQAAILEALQREMIILRAVPQP